MTRPGWIEVEELPPHRDLDAEAAFAATCAACPHVRSGTLTEPTTGQTYVVCAIKACPRGWVIHKYNDCPAGKVPPAGEAR